MIRETQNNLLSPLQDAKSRFFEKDQQLSKLRSDMQMAALPLPLCKREAEEERVYNLFLCLFLSASRSASPFPSLSLGSSYSLLYCVPPSSCPSLPLSSLVESVGFVKGTDRTWKGNKKKSFFFVRSLLLLYRCSPKAKAVNEVNTEPRPPTTAKSTSEIVARSCCGCFPCGVLGNLKTLPGHINGVRDN